MLREPWEEMEPGKIYVGSEHKTYADEWMKAESPGSSIAISSNSTAMNHA
jgi:hypothetical protein